MIKYIEKTVDYLQEKGFNNPEIGIILGTGLGQLINEIEVIKEVQVIKEIEVIKEVIVEKIVEVEKKEAPLLFSKLKKSKTLKDHFEDLEKGSDPDSDFLYISDEENSKLQMKDIY